MSIDTLGLEWAQKFHETYERLAPEFGYETRTDTRQFESESKNGQLMIAVCGELIPQALAAGRRAGLEQAAQACDERARLATGERAHTAGIGRGMEPTVAAQLRMCAAMIRALLAKEPPA